MNTVNTALTLPYVAFRGKAEPTTQPAAPEQQTPTPTESFQPGLALQSPTSITGVVSQTPAIAAESAAAVVAKPLNSPSLLFADSSATISEVNAVDRRVPLLMEPVAASLSKHWDFLYARNDPGRLVPDPNKIWSDRQRETTAKGIDSALQQLRDKGHEKGTGKVAILGGGYEVDMAPLLEEFAEVHVIDLSDKPFPVVERQNASDPNKGKLKFIQTDLCGVSSMTQGLEVERLRQDRQSGKGLDVEGVKNFMGNLGELQPTALESGHYTMVVAPVITESMPYGPLITDIEARREDNTKAAGIDDSNDRRSTWKHASSILPEDFYFDPKVRDGFDKLFLHQSKEINRILTPGGVGVVSFWTRPDERQPTLAPQEKSQLHRLGDNAVTSETFHSFFAGFEHQEAAQTRIYGEDKKPTVHAYTLAKPN